MDNGRQHRPRRGLRGRAQLAMIVALAAVTLLAFAGSGSAAAQAVPTNSAPPTISGTEKDGETLTANTGTWTNSPTSYDYQWQRCNSGGGSCSNISSATSSTYTLGSADVGNTLRVGVQATNGDGPSGWSYSGTTGVIATAATKPSNTSPPTISGTAQQGQELTASVGSWSGTSPIDYSTSWERCDSSGNNCSSLGILNSKYTTTSSDVGHRLRATVTASNSAGSSSATSATTDVIAASGSKPSNTAVPTITGTVQDNQTLTAHAGTWTGSTPITYKYTWQRCDANGNNCSNVATGATYTVSSHDVGHRLRLVVTATNSSGSTTATSAATAVGLAAGTAPKNTKKPTIAGTVQVGKILTASVGTWTGAGAALVPLPVVPMRHGRQQLPGDRRWDPLHLHPDGVGQSATGSGSSSPRRTHSVPARSRSDPTAVVGGSAARRPSPRPASSRSRACPCRTGW